MVPTQEQLAQLQAKVDALKTSVADQTTSESASLEAGSVVDAAQAQAAVAYAALDNAVLVTNKAEQDLVSFVTSLFATSPA